MHKTWIIITALLLATPSAHAAFFPDVPEYHHVYEAVEDLRIRGLIQGYPDGTFKPDRQVNRAEALKLIVAPVTKSEDFSEFTEESYEDVSNGVWFYPYIERAHHILNIIDGPPKTTKFHPERQVITVEFLKMFFLTNNMDDTEIKGVLSPLSSDVKNSSEWYYPYIRFALFTGMLELSEEELLHPDKALTRADIALLIHRFIKYKEGNQTQELITYAEEDFLITIQNLHQKNVDDALKSATRAILRTRGALRSRSDSPLVQGLVLIAEGFVELVKAEIHFKNEAWGKMREAAQVAWNAADKAGKLHNDLEPIASELRRMARILATEAKTEELYGE